MAESTNIYHETASYWFHKWKEALMEKDFDRAKDYFKRAHKWKRRAKIDGMLQEICGGAKK